MTDADDLFAKFRQEIDKALWGWLVPGAKATTDFWGKRQEVTIEEVDHGMVSQTGIMVRLREHPEKGYFDAAWFKPVK